MVSVATIAIFYTVCAAIMTAIFVIKSNAMGAIAMALSIIIALLLAGLLS